MLDFEEIEDCFPERGALCAIDGRVSVSAQWLHDFAHKVAEKEREACAAIAETFLWWETDGCGDDEANVFIAKAIRMRSN